MLADALTSVLAIIALLAGRYMGWVWLDPLMGIVGAIVIARWSCSLMRDTAAVLLDTTDTAIEAEVRERLRAQVGALPDHGFTDGGGVSRAHVLALLDGEPNG